MTTILVCKIHGNQAITDHMTISIIVICWVLVLMILAVGTPKIPGGNRVKLWVNVTLTLSNDPLLTNT